MMKINYILPFESLIKLSTIFLPICQATSKELIQLTNPISLFSSMLSFNRCENFTSFTQHLFTYFIWNSSKAGDLFADSIVCDANQSKDRIHFIHLTSYTTRPEAVLLGFLLTIHTFLHPNTLHIE